jgi:CMP-N,N'-diacetyllegionaminic acid synthase
MYKNHTFLAIIPARGGSKGIPQKNIIDINGKPLIKYSIEEAIGSQFLDRVIVSTDDMEIASVAKECGAEVPFLRPSYLAGDNAKTIDVLLHVIQELSRRSQKYDYLVLLQPTQPLRKSWHIDEAIKSIVDNREERLVSISPVEDHPVLIRSVDDKGYLKNLLSTNSTVRRQDFPDFYKVNGAIYINKINDNLNEGTSLNDNSYPYIMQQEYDLDIDEPKDIELLKFILEDHTK